MQCHACAVADMKTPSWNILTLLLVLVGLAGCAGGPPAIPKAPTPADLIKAIPQGNNTTLVNVAPPTYAHQTLPDFLGITRCCYGAQGCCQQILYQGALCFPGLAGILPGGPGVLPVVDPNSIAGQNPAVQTATDIKAAEDAAPAKIAALRYLATIGCAGCYKGVEDAFIDALSDCTEEVRYEAVLALRKSACGCHKCAGCCKDGCCSEKIQKKLREMAYETDDMGCPKESSDRVRRAARLALRQCGPPIMKPEPAAEPTVKPEEKKGEGAPALPAPAAGALPSPAGAGVLPPPVPNGNLPGPTPPLPPPVQK
jgi:hypothetical protein